MEKYTRKKYSAGGLNWHKYPTKKVRGLYQIKVDGMDSKVNIVSFERYDDDQYSLYPLEKDRNLFKEILVKSTALNSLDKGISVKGETNDGKKVSIKRLSNQDFSYANGGGVGQVEHFTLDKDKLNEDAKWYADRIKSGQMSTTKKSIEERIEEYKKDLFLLEIGRKKPSNIIGTGYKGNAKKMANTWLLQEIYKDTKILELIGNNYSNGGGVGLKGNQSRIDMNHNGIIDAEDFKLLRSSMNGAWRNDHEHVNSTSRKNGKVIDYEVRYARKHNPSRKGYKGKSNFEDGGAVNLDFRNFTLNELSKSLPQDVSIMWLFQKKPEKFIRIHDKEWNKYATKHWTISDYGQMELSKGSENLYIDLKVYEASENAPEVEYFVTIYTKDNHNGLKEFSKNLIQKFATGGGLKDDEDYKLIESYWGNKKEEEFSENEFKNYAKKNEIKNVWIGNKKIKYFKFFESDGRMLMRYALRENSNLKYYLSFLNHSVALNLNNAVFLEDVNYKDFKNRILTKETLDFLKTKNSYATGGGFEKLSNSVAKRYEGDAVAPKYQRMYGKRYDKEEAKEVGDKVAGKMKAMQMQNKKAFGGFFKKESIKTKYPDLDDKQVMLKNGEYVQVVDQIDDVLMVINSNQLGTGIRPKRINISEVDMSSFM